MRMHTAVGGVDVALRGSAVAAVAPFTTAGSLCLLGEEFERLAADDGWLLALDHRERAAVESRAYIECWCPALDFEDRLSAVLVLCDVRPEYADRADLPGAYTPVELARVIRIE